MQPNHSPLVPHQLTEDIDFDKFFNVIKANKWLLIIVIILCNTIAYFTIRWTKNIYESTSELKLEIKKDATELGLKQLTEDPNLNALSGEIEQLKSKVFFSRVIDSLDISVSYYNEGNVLSEELYKRSPFKVKYTFLNDSIQEKVIHFFIEDKESFSLKIENDNRPISGKFNTPLSVYGNTLIFYLTGKDENWENLKLSFIIHSRDYLINYLSDNTKVEPINFDANTILVSFHDCNPLKAFDIVNKIDSQYILYSSEQKNLANKQKISWLNEELSQLEEKMGDFENYFEDFILKNKSSDLTQDLKKTLYAINMADSQYFQLNKKIVAISEFIEKVDKNKFNLSFQEQSFLPEYLHKKLESLNKSQQELDRLVLTYHENTFAFQQKQKEISLAKDRIYSQLITLKNDWLKNMSELYVRKKQLENKFTTIPNKNTLFNKKQRFYRLYEEFYLTMMQSKAQFEIAQAGNTPDFKILSPAHLSTTPISPKRFMILGIGLVGSIILSFIIIAILYVLNNKITSVASLERQISIPLLGAIPSSGRKSESVFHVTTNPRSMLSEAIRTLRTNLGFYISGNSSKIITITSTISGEGKSFLAANLSGVISLSKKKVILLDLDMRKQKKDPILSAKDPANGISVVLTKKITWRQCVQETSVENLHFLPSGPHPPNPSELLLNAEFNDLLEDLKQEYDYIIIDTPPVGLVTDGIIAMKKSDLSIYVIRANYSKQAFLKTLLRIQNIHKISGLAVVLNAIPHNGKAYGYGYYTDVDKEKTSPKWSLS